MKNLILPHLIASGYSAQRAVCFLGVPSQKVFKISSSFVVRAALNPGGSDRPPAPFVPRLRSSPGSAGPVGGWGDLEVR